MKLGKVFKKAGNENSSLTFSVNTEVKGKMNRCGLRLAILSHYPFKLYESVYSISVSNCSNPADNV